MTTSTPGARRKNILTPLLASIDSRRVHMAARQSEPHL